MPKRPDSQETLLLTLELLQRIPPRGTTTAARLQEELAGEGFVRELRTIQRLLDTLCNSDRYGIERDQSSKPYRYWRTHSRFALNLLGLSTRESLLLTLAEQQLKHLLPAKLMTSMDGFFAQARGQLAEKGVNELENQWLDKVRVVSTSQPLLPPKVDPEVFEQVSNALYANQWLEADYQNAESKRASYKVMPLGLAQQGPRMYLVCRFDGHDNERCLALHRFISAKASTLTFERPKDFNLKQFDNDGRFGYGDGTLIRLSFRIEKEAGFHLLETPLSADQQVVELDDAYEITATVVDSAMLEWWLRGFGECVIEVNKLSI